MDRVARLERQVRALGLCVVLLAAACVISVFAGSSRAEEKPANVIARRIAVVDERGVERVVISAPSPDPKGGGVTLTTWNAPVIQMKQKGKILFNQPPDAPLLH